QASLIGVIVASVAAVVGLISYGYVKVSRERDFAREQERIANVERQKAEASEADATRSRDEALAAKAQAELEQKRAQRNFQQAQDAVDQMLTTVGAERLANEPRMEKIRRDLLGRALVFYERFAATEGESTGIRFKTGMAQQRVGDIQEMLGDR